jgi:hypothetical protein
MLHLTSDRSRSGYPDRPDRNVSWPTITVLLAEVSLVKPLRFYLQQDFPGDDFGFSKIEVKQAFFNKLAYLVVRRIGAFAVIEYHHSGTDAFAAIQHIIGSESARLPQDLTDAAFGAAGSVRNRTNLAVLSNENVHRATHASQFQPRTSKHIAPPPLRNHQTSDAQLRGDSRDFRAGHRAPELDASRRPG